MRLPRRLRVEAVILAAALLSGCSAAPPASTVPTVPTDPSAPPSGAAPGASGTGPTGLGGPRPTGRAGTSGPTGPLATPSVVDGLEDSTSLEPPVPEVGDVPSPADPTAPIEGGLRLGPIAELAAQTIGQGGGTIAAQGFEIRIPDGTLSGDTAFRVRQAPILGQDFGDFLTPLTPLYLVDDGNANLLAPVTIVLPAAIPDGTMAMAFTYDETAGRLSPLSPIAHSANSLTVGATHFSGLFGALVDLSKLPETVDTGFRPGTDDWQFPNYGSYLAPGGHCEGQSVSAIWYFINQRGRNGARPLFGLYDNNGAAARTPGLWQDDSDGYRLASVVHADPIAVPFTYSFLQRMWDNVDGRLTYLAMRTAIALSGEPQLVLIDTAAHDAPHTIIAYRVTRERIFVADPNYPGRLRTIRYDAATGTLGPYSSGSSASEIAAAGAHSYTRFAFMPPRASSSDAAMAAHWADFEAGTEGDGRFPAYMLEALTGTDAQGREEWVPLVNGHQTPGKQLTLRLRDPNARDQTALKVRRDTSSAVVAAGRRVTIDLDDGDNPIGIEELGAKPGWTDWEYVDFVRLTVTSGVQAGWKLAGGGTEVLRVATVFYAQELTGGPGSLTSTLTATYPTDNPPAPVAFSWSAPDTLIPYSDRGSIASPKATDGYLAIDPRITPVSPDSRTGDYYTAKIEAYLVASPDAPTPGVYPFGLGVYAWMKPDGTLDTGGQQEVPSYTPGWRLYLEVHVIHEGAEAFYQYVYEWSDPT